MDIFSTIPLAQAVAHNIDGISMLMTTFIIIAFIVCWCINRISILRIRKNADSIKDMTVIMKHTLNLNGDSVLRLSVAEQCAYNIHGNFLPEKGMTFLESKKYIHPDDWPAYVDFCMKLKNGQKTAECEFRWNASLDPENPQWRYIHDLGIAEYANNLSRIPTNFFCTITDKTDEVMEKQQELQLTDKYRKIFDLSLVGLAFYDNEGKLLTTNEKMREILNFQSEDDPYYYNKTIYEMPAFREVINNRRIEDMWFCTKSVIVDRGVNCYTEIRVHPIYDEEGMLVYITFSICDITQERELYLQNKQNDEDIRQQNKAIQQYEAELQYLMESCDMRFWRASFLTRDVTIYKGLAVAETTISLDAISNFFFDNDKAKEMFLHPEAYFSNPSAYLIHTRPIFHKTDKPKWNIIDSVPEFNQEGKIVGCYGIVRNVSSLIDKQEQLKKETERAKDSGHMKSVFMANMTHEIRTPLNSIVGFSDVLPMMQTPEEKQEIVKVILNNCDMLLRLINDMLAISTLDSSGIDIETKETDFSRDFSEICQSLAERVQNPNVQFIADNPLPSFIINVDSGRIQQVLINFVTNAVKYTQEGHIKVGYAQRDGGLYIYCEDTGAGIPKEAQQKVFERFVKLNDYVQGTGLGLSICKAIAERCHGKIGVDSEGEGKGSTFWMWIPLDSQNEN